MITPQDRSAQAPKAIAQCDDCDHSQYEPCDYERKSNGAWNINEGQVIHRLTKHGWTYIKGKLRCMACSLKRKGIDVTIAERVRNNAREDRTASEIASLSGLTLQQVYQSLHAQKLPFRRSENGFSNQYSKKKPEVKSMVVTDIRQPSQSQKREILAMLSVAYDADAGRYKDCESDVTVAGAIGGGCMFGWVAQLREEFFGPDGGNEEIEALQSELRAWMDGAAKASEAAKAALADLTRVQGECLGFQRRLDALVKAAGPRATRIA